MSKYPNIQKVKYGFNLLTIEYLESVHIQRFKTWVSGRHLCNYAPRAVAVFNSAVLMSVVECSIDECCVVQCRPDRRAGV